MRSTSKFTQRSVTSSTNSVASGNETLHRSQNKIFNERDVVADTEYQPNLNCSQLQQRSPALVISVDSLNERCEELFGCTEPGATVRLHPSHIRLLLSASLGVNADIAAIS